MPKYDLMVYSNCKPGTDAEFNAWYDDVHLPDLLTLPCIPAAERYDVKSTLSGEAPSHRYLAIYHIDAEGPEVAMAGIKDGMKGGWVLSDTLLPDVMTLIVERR